MICECPRCQEYKENLVQKSIEHILHHQPMTITESMNALNQLVAHARLPWKNHREIAEEVFKRLHPGEPETGQNYADILMTVEYIFKNGWRE